MKRKTELISKNKVVSAINLFEKNIDEKIKSIEIVTPTYYFIQGEYKQYSVDIANNKVNIVYPDPEY